MASRGIEYHDQTNDLVWTPESPSNFYEITTSTLVVPRNEQDSHSDRDLREYMTTNSPRMFSPTSIRPKTCQSSLTNLLEAAKVSPRSGQNIEYIDSNNFNASNYEDDTTKETLTSSTNETEYCDTNDAFFIGSYNLNKTDSIISDELFAEEFLSRDEDCYLFENDNIPDIPNGASPFNQEEFSPELLLINTQESSNIRARQIMNKVKNATSVIYDQYKVIEDCLKLDSSLQTNEVYSDVIEKHSSIDERLHNRMNTSSDNSIENGYNYLHTTHGKTIIQHHSPTGHHGEQLNSKWYNNLHNNDWTVSNINHRSIIEGSSHSYLHQNNNNPEIEPQITSYNSSLISGMSTESHHEFSTYKFSDKSNKTDEPCYSAVPKVLSLLEGKMVTDHVIASQTEMKARNISIDTPHLLPLKPAVRKVSLTQLAVERISTRGKVKN